MSAVHVSSKTKPVTGDVSTAQQHHWTVATVLRFLFCVGGIYASFLAWAFFQERITAEGYVDPSTGEKERFETVAVLNIVQATAACVLGFAFTIASGASFNAPLSSFFTVAVTTTLASPFGYYALNYIDYPLFALGKACKLVPVMIMSIFMNGARYSWQMYLAVGLITLGVALSSIKPGAEFKKSYFDSLIGLFFIFINLFMDGFTNAAQDTLNRKSKTKIPASVFMAYMNLWGIGLLAAYLIGEHFLFVEAGPGSSILKAVDFSTRHPQVVYDVLAFSFCGAIGQLFIFFNIREFGALTNTTICISRKFVTIIISVIMFGHVMSITKWMGVVLVFSGLGLQTWYKYQAAKAKAKTA